MTRISALLLLLPALAAPAAAAPSSPLAAPAFPVKGRSLGGVVRAAPGMDSQRLDSLRETEPIVIVKKTDVEMNGYPWFQIRWRDRKGYQWGRILCAETPLEGAYETCR
jgi:hypothetical protein